MARFAPRASASVWRWPATIVVLTAAGLVMALVGEGGTAQSVAWTLLIVPLAVIVIGVAKSLRSR